MYVGASLIGNALFFCCLYNKYIYCSFALLGWLIFKHCGRFFNRKRPFFFLVCSPYSVVCCLLSAVLFNLQFHFFASTKHFSDAVVNAVEVFQGMF